MDERIHIPLRKCDALARSVTVLGWGAFKIGRNEGAKYPSAYAVPSADESTALIHAVLDMGIGVIDTAPAYGLSEQRIGAALGDRRSGIFLSTKVGEQFHQGVSAYDFGEAAVADSVLRSLELLRTQWLDLVWVHSNGDDETILRDGGAVQALQRAKESGQIRAIGFSPKSCAGALAAIAQTQIDAVMLEFHPRDASMGEAIALAGAAGKAVFIKKPLASGDLQPAHAMPWILSHRQVTCVVVGGVNADRLRATAVIAAKSAYSGQ